MALTLGLAIAVPSFAAPVAAQPTAGSIDSRRSEPVRTQRPKLDPGPRSGAGRRPAPSSPPSQARPRGARQALVPFKTAPFPYTGLVPTTGRPFLDIVLEDRSGRLSPRTGTIFWADETYSDSRVLLDLPGGFSTGRPGVMIVFLHGNGALIERDVIERQQVPRQVRDARLNSVLVAPQFAADALDSSAGAFWQPGAFTAFLDEAAGHLARLYGAIGTRRYFRSLPIVLVAYSGGYHPAAYILANSAGHERIVGVLLLDALYGDIAKYRDWITGPDAGFLVSTYTHSSADGNAELQRLLAEDNIVTETTLPPLLSPGRIAFVATAPTVNHQDFVTRAWVDDPLRDLLVRLGGYGRAGR